MSLGPTALAWVLPVSLVLTAMMDDPVPGAALPEPGNFLLPRGSEEEAYRRAGLMERLRPITTGHVHKYAFTVYEVRPGPP